VEPRVDRSGAEVGVEDGLEVLHQALAVGVRVPERDEHQEDLVEVALDDRFVERERVVE
jgi:hypothetical protein